MATARKTPATRKTPAKAAPIKTVAVKASAPKAVPAAAASRAAPAAAASKADKPKKAKLVRDSFTIPKSEYAVLEALKARALKAGTSAKKSELLRAAIMALAALSDSAFAKALSAVPAIKTGRPAGS